MDDRVRWDDVLHEHREVVYHVLLSDLSRYRDQVSFCRGAGLHQVADDVSSAVRAICAALEALGYRAPEGVSDE